MAAPSGTRTTPNSEYECLYTGPALTSDEAGEVQIVADLIAKARRRHRHLAVERPAMAEMLKEKPIRQMPIMTIDADLQPEDRALRKTYLGTDNYLMGVKIGRAPEEAEAEGRHGLPAARQPGGRQHQRARRGLPRHDLTGSHEGPSALTGEGGWTEVDGCPVFTNDDIATANQQIADVTRRQPGPRRLRARRRLGPVQGREAYQRHRQAVSRPLQGQAASSSSPATPSAAEMDDRSRPATATPRSASGRSRWATGLRTS